MMIAMKKTKSHVQALPGMAKDEAKVADVVHLLGTSRSGGPSPRAPLPPKSLDDNDKERSGSSSLDDEFLSYLSGSGNIPPPGPPSPFCGGDGTRIRAVRIQPSVSQSECDARNGWSGECLAVNDARG